jgi:hypothetical protein
VFIGRASGFHQLQGFKKHERVVAVSGNERVNRYTRNLSRFLGS